VNLVEPNNEPTPAHDKQLKHLVARSLNSRHIFIRDASAESNRYTLSAEAMTTTEDFIELNSQEPILLSDTNLSYGRRYRKRYSSEEPIIKGVFIDERNLDI
jgi:hypothetical protein